MASTSSTSVNDGSEVSLASDRSSFDVRLAAGLRRPPGARMQRYAGETDAGVSLDLNYASA